MLADRTASALRKSATSLSSETYDSGLCKQVKPEIIEYRILVDAPAVSEEPLALADFLETAASDSRSVTG